MHACISCPGRTRHRGPCASCRARGVRLVGDTLTVPLELHVPKVLTEGRTTVRVLTSPPADLRAPTVAELQAGVDLTQFLADWHGTDCPCPACARDRIPGRYA